MTLKFTLDNEINPKNQLVIAIESMHGDADCDTSKEVILDIPIDKFDSIEKIIKLTEQSLYLIRDKDQSPFYFEGWKEKDFDNITGLPVIGAKVKIREVDSNCSDYWNCFVGKVLEIKDENLIVESEEGLHLVSLDSKNFAPEDAIYIDIVGYEAYFEVDKIEIEIYGESDATTDHSTAASSSISTVTYYNDKREKFNVTGF